MTDPYTIRAVHVPRRPIPIGARQEAGRRAVSHAARFATVYGGKIHRIPSSITVTRCRLCFPIGWDAHRYDPGTAARPIARLPPRSWLIFKSRAPRQDCRPRELIPHENYRLVYEIQGETVWMLAPVHTARKWPILRDCDRRRPPSGSPRRSAGTSRSTPRQGENAQQARCSMPTRRASSRRASARPPSRMIES
jgi:hypothetical protein